MRVIGGTFSGDIRPGNAKGSSGNGQVFVKFWLWDVN